MWTRSILIIGGVLLAAFLPACATGAPVPVDPPLDTPPATSPSTEPAVPTTEHKKKVASEADDPAASARARTWIETAAIPPGAVQTERIPEGLGTATGWPCTPIALSFATWTISDMTVPETMNWLLQNPTDGLVSSLGPAAQDHRYSDESVTGGNLGFIPEEGAQEGLIYSIERTESGVTVRAEAAARTASSTCAEAPFGGTWGAPGQG